MESNVGFISEWMQEERMEAGRDQLILFFLTFK